MFVLDADLGGLRVATAASSLERGYTTEKKKNEKGTCVLSERGGKGYCPKKRLFCGNSREKARKKPRGEARGNTNYTRKGSPREKEKGDKTKKHRQKKTVTREILLIRPQKGRPESPTERKGGDLDGSRLNRHGTKDPYQKGVNQDAVKQGKQGQVFHYGRNTQVPVPSNCGATAWGGRGEK